MELEKIVVIILEDNVEVVYKNKFLLCKLVMLDVGIYFKDVKIYIYENLVYSCL